MCLFSLSHLYFFFFFFFNDTAPTEIYTLSLHDALPIWGGNERPPQRNAATAVRVRGGRKDNRRTGAVRDAGGLDGQPVEINAHGSGRLLIIEGKRAALDRCLSQLHTPSLAARRVC